MKNAKNIIIGLILIAIGILVGLRSFEIIEFNIFFPGWWTLFIIIPAFLGLLSNDDKTGDIIGLVVGIVLLLACNDLISFEIILKLLFPFILVFIGLSYIFKNVLINKAKERTKKIKDDQKFYSTFSTQKLDYTKEKFEGCEVEAIFGGAEIDLSDAEIKSDVTINATAIFGGIDIKIPRDVKVKVNQSAIFGGVNNGVKNNKVDDKSHTIYINANCLFGGVEVK